MKQQTHPAQAMREMNQVFDGILMHSEKYKNAEDVEDEPSHSNVYSIHISYYDVLVYQRMILSFHS